MFELTEEQRMLRDLVAKFVDQELMPLEPQVLAREASGGLVGLTEEENAPLLEKCRDLFSRSSWKLTELPRASAEAQVQQMSRKFGKL